MKPKVSYYLTIGQHNSRLCLIQCVGYVCCHHMRPYHRLQSPLLTDNFRKPICLVWSSGRTPNVSQTNFVAQHRAHFRNNGASDPAHSQPLSGEKHRPRSMEKNNFITWTFLHWRSRRSSSRLNPFYPTTLLLYRLYICTWVIHHRLWINVVEPIALPCLLFSIFYLLLYI